MRYVTCVFSHNLSKRLAEAPCKFQFVDMQGTSSLITADEAGIHA